MRLIALMLLALAPLAPARADDPPAPPKAESAAPQPGHKAKVLRLEEFTVEGRLQKPQAFFFLPRNNLKFEDGDKKESFLPKIVKTCDKDPF